MADNDRRTIWPRTLPFFAGDFSWDERALHANIKAEKPDYDPHDPATWPRMTMRHLRTALRNVERGDKILPVGIAYDRQICVKYHCEPMYQGDVLVTQAHTKTSVLMDNLFYRFPFQFGRSGVPYSSESLLAKNRDFYVDKVTGGRSMAANEINEPQSDKPKSSNEAFEEVLQMMNETPSNGDVGIGALQRENIALKAKLADQTEQARSNEQIHRTLLRNLTEKLAVTKQAEADLNETNLGFREQARKSRHRRKRAQREVKALQKAVEEKDQLLAEQTRRLQAAEQAAADADERVLKIWTEMKRARDSEDNKRKADEGASDAQA